MKKESLHKLFALVATAGFIGFAPVAHAQDDEETPLAKAMDEISGSLKSLRRLERDPEKWTKSAASIRGGADACIKAMAFVPAEIEAMPDGPEKLKAKADARRLMGLTLAALCELELAFLAEDEAKVDELKDKLSDIKTESHEKYNKGE
jgi:hypothetical protein